MNAFVFQLAVVFVPGLAWLAIVDHLTTGAGRRNTLATALRAFAFGAIAYFAWFIGRALGVRCIWGAWPPLPDGLKGAPGIEYVAALRARDIVGTTFLSPVLAVAWSFCANRKYFLRAMKSMGITRKFGDENVWEYALNMGTPAVEYVNVRDFEEGLVYTGFVRAFSEGGKHRELLLDQVKVYDMETAQEQFSVPLLYLSRKPDALHVEYPYQAPLEPTEKEGDTGNVGRPEGQEDRP